jgi:hypothetical protein
LSATFIARMARSCKQLLHCWRPNDVSGRLMVRLEFSGGALAREKTLGYGFAGRAGPCDFIGVTTGMSVADLIARCGFPARRARNNLAVAAYAGSRASAWGETWFYPADGSRAARRIQLQEGRVVDVQVVH